MRPDTWPFSWFTPFPHSHTDRWRSGTPHKAPALAIFWPKHHNLALTKFAQVLTPIFLLLTLTLRKFFHFHCIIYPTHLQLPWWRDNQCNSLHLPVVIILCLIIVITAWLWMTRFSTEPCPLKFRFPTAKNYSGSREAFLSHKQVVKQNIFLVYSVTFIYYHFT